MAPTSSPVVVLPAVFPRDKDVVAKLFLAYAAFVNVDLSFQSFENEVAQLPGKYAAEARGEVFLAYTTTTTSTSTSKIELADCIGCVAFRELAPNRCELKRLYTLPEARGLGAGKLLVEKSMAKAKELGYEEMVLDTLSSLETARKLYARLGFVEIEKYYDNPLEMVVYYKVVL